MTLQIRVLITITVLLLLISALIVGIGITTIVALLVERGIYAPVIAAAVGAASTYIFTRILDWGRSLKEARDISRSLYHELADRAARCLNDYLKPWRTRTSPMKPGRVGKFRPVDPVVYPSVAAKLGLIRPAALFSVVQFYFRLDALRREIDHIREDYKANDDVDNNRLELVTRRLEETLEPALDALDKMNIEGGIEIDRAAALAYPNLRASGKSLKQLLREHSMAGRA